jgi:hypothetical protein
MYFHPAAIVVMVDNLPCELPKDASEGFEQCLWSTLFLHSLMMIKMDFG